MARAFQNLVALPLKKKTVGMSWPVSTKPLFDRGKSDSFPNRRQCSVFSFSGPLYKEDEKSPSLLLRSTTCFLDIILQQDYTEEKRLSNHIASQVSIPHDSNVTCKQRHNEAVHLTSPQPILLIPSRPVTHSKPTSPKLPRPHFRLKSAHSDTGKLEIHHDQAVVCKPSTRMPLNYSNNWPAT